MSAESSIAPIGGHAILGGEGERAWDRLRQHADWSEGDFWLAFVFAQSAPLVHELQWRMAEFLKTRGASQRVLRPSSPDELKLLLPELIREPPRCTWVEAMYLDPLRQDSAKSATNERNNPDHTWACAWDHLMLRANERRDLVRDSIRGGLVVAAPAEFKTRIRDAAPDLWSVHSLVLDIPAVPVVGTPIERIGALDLLNRLASAQSAQAEKAMGVDLSRGVTRYLAKVGRARRRLAKADRLSVETDADLLLRESAAELVAQRPTEARDRALAAHLLAQHAADVLLQARALHAMARAEQKLDDLPAARRHVYQALELHNKDDRLRLNLVQLGAALSAASHDWDEAFAGSQKAVALARVLWRPDDIMATLDLSSTLRILGLFCKSLGSSARLEWARTLLTEAVQLSRAFADAAQTYGWLADTIGDLAGVERALGDTSSAHAHYTEALSIVRSSGIFIDALEWQSVFEILTGLAEAEVDLANLARARDLYAEAVAVAQRAVTQIGGEDTQAALTEASARLSEVATMVDEAAMQSVDSGDAIKASSESHI